MNPQTFSTLGYASVVLWLLLPVLLILHHVRRPRGWLCHLALVIGIAAFALAKVNSATHVNRIQPDRSSEIAAAEALKEKARKAALEAREGEVANVRFAEDSLADRLDEGGMDDADRKYMETVLEKGEPGYKKGPKKERSGQRQQDDSLEGMLNTEEADDGLKSEFTEKAEAAEPIVMAEAEVAMANRLDKANLQIVRLLLLVTFILLIIDYLKRANIYEEAYLPLPLPSSWLNCLTPAPPVNVRDEPRRDLASELAWLTKRGDTFVCLTADSSVASAVPASLPKFKGMQPVDVLKVTDAISDDFVFESLWYGRSSFVVDSAARAEQMIKRFVELMAERRSTRAAVRQTVHVLWDIDAPVPETQRGEFAGLAKATGLSLMVRAE
jgi:hypothetical protein